MRRPGTWPRWCAPTGRWRCAWAGSEVFAAIEDAPRLRDGLGVPLPHGVPLAFIEPVADPVGDLVSRFARTHGPFTAPDVAAALGLGVAVVLSVLERLVADSRVMVRGVPAGRDARRGAAARTEYCDAAVLRMIRTRSLAALRAEVEPVDQQTFARFLPGWQGIGARLRGIDGVLAVIEQLAGVPAPGLRAGVLRVAGPRAGLPAVDARRAHECR